MAARLLVIDDEPSILEFFEIVLRQEGYEVEIIGQSFEALKKIETENYDLVVTDLFMPQVDGMAILEKVRDTSPETLVIMITAFATAETAVEAMKRGAYDYLMKPFKVDEIKLVIRNALEKSSLRRENVQLKKASTIRSGFAQFVGISEKMNRVFDLIEQVAPGRSSVLIVGESGTGKELAAKAIHELSPRSDKPFVSINCAAIPENLIESELFGYVRGAFTGATGNKMGLFEAAHHGTFFLDEVGELPPQVQVKLLRVLQERAVRRIGSTTSTAIDVRIISATNREIEEEVKEGKFREDLFYRLNVIQILIPPLRDRREDIPLLVRHFLKRFSEEQGKKEVGITPEALDRLTTYEFLGNVRELENVIEQCLALERGSEIQLASIPEKIRNFESLTMPLAEIPAEASIDLEKEIDSYERKLLLEALRRTGGAKKKAAALLGISFRSIRYRLLKHGIDTEDDEVGDADAPVEA